MKVLAVLVSLLLLFSTISCESSSSKGDAQVKNSQKILIDLYTTFRNLVFPKDPLSSGPSYNRFVLLYPGKVLNYWDYYPGADYHESLLRQNTSAPEVPIPPSVMEKWFDMADVTVGADPFTGGISGKSMARAYETIVSQMQLLGIETKTADAQAKYNMALQYLTATVKDPDNVTLNTTKLSLYERYQSQYADVRLLMEDKIEGARHTRSGIEYELWFQRNYGPMNSKVEGAYIKWLIFGEKDLVELYKTYVDTTSSGAELEDARMSLRASGVTSLDRTRTIYPVSFEPGNWYEYLLPKTKGPSRDMLIAKRSMLESERDALKSMVNFNEQNHQQASQTIKKLEGKLNSSTELRDNKTSEASSTMNDCMRGNAEQPVPGTVENTTAGAQSESCKKFKKATQDAVSATFVQAQVNSEYESASFLLNSKDQFNGFLSNRADHLDKELAIVNAQLNVSEPHLGGVADSREFQDLNELLNQTEQNLDDQWIQFEYDSDSSHINTDQETNSVNVAVGVGVGVAGVAGFDGSVQYGKGTTDLKQALNSANMKVSGSILRVTIKRPWFKPSIFEDPSLLFIQRDEVQQKNTYVSPGPKTEKEFKDIVGGTTGNLYLLPEYVTSFLLARDVTLEFSGLDANSVSHAMQQMVGVSFSGSYDMFSMSASVGVGKTKQSVNADRTANGMIINIPGAQIVGYYTEVLPQCPRSQK